MHLYQNLRTVHRVRLPLLPGPCYRLCRNSPPHANRLFLHYRSACRAVFAFFCRSGSAHFYLLRFCHFTFAFVPRDSLISPSLPALLFLLPFLSLSQSGGLSHLMPNPLFFSFRDSPHHFHFTHMPLFCATHTHTHLTTWAFYTSSHCLPLHLFYSILFLFPYFTLVFAFLPFCLFPLAGKLPFPLTCPLLQWDLGHLHTCIHTFFVLCLPWFRLPPACTHRRAFPCLQHFSALFLRTSAAPGALFLYSTAIPTALLEHCCTPPFSFYRSLFVTTTCAPRYLPAHSGTPLRFWDFTGRACVLERHATVFFPVCVCCSAVHTAACAFSPACCFHYRNTTACTTPPPRHHACTHAVFCATKTSPQLCLFVVRLYRLPVIYHADKTHEYIQFLITHHYYCRHYTVITTTTCHY